MSHREEEAPRGREPACLLCQQSEADLDICGEKLFIHGLCAHEFCLFFATNFPDRPVHRGGLWCLPSWEIRAVVSLAAQQICCICGQRGATISCCRRNCDLSFHLPCAKQGGCVTQFCRPFRAFCPAHSPEQAVEATPEPGTQCLICLEPVEDRKTFNTLVCPACKTAWFHRDCIQGQALHAGRFSFQCPLCRNDEAFIRDMFTVGIQIPLRPPSWEGFNAFDELGDRHRHCDASECLFPGGRHEAEEEGPWQLLLCSSCAAEGTHRRCSGLRNSITRWECDGCAGLGTGNRQSTLAPEMSQSLLVSAWPDSQDWSLLMAPGNPRPSAPTQAAWCYQGCLPVLHHWRPSAPAPASRCHPLDLQHHRPATTIPTPRQHRSSLCNLPHKRRAAPALTVRQHRGHPRAASQQLRTAAAPAVRGLTAGKTTPVGNVGPKIHTFGPEVPWTGLMCQHQVLGGAGPGRDHQGHPAGKTAPACNVQPQIHPAGPEVPMAGPAHQHQVLGGETQGRQQPGLPKGNTTPASSVGRRTHPADPEVARTGAVLEHQVLPGALTGGTVRQGPTADTSHVTQGGAGPQRERASMPAVSAIRG
ncbi:G2/M phase-specific E3 ubiquitin-protein ligase-like [Chiroxiphia lanceolata]|uniref:G2/M phase-specific E3 ubiquitin-protein ligase-like n=1 Tax=Chiroxiphia lanceolata TaxID=296741 RepID=UPI0013CE4F1C|nr:G2/M phase-specific E3 ubiquitin-protein ligase-like [Chiroxiphia lanceolata]